MTVTGFLDRAADVSTFDKALDAVRKAVEALIKPQAVSDFLHGTWLGHPLHPVLAQVPIGTWLSAGVLDAIPPMRPAATVLIGVGVTAAVPTATAGAADWTAQESGVRRLGAVHALANTAALSLYVGSLAARARGRGGLGRLLSYSALGMATGSAAIGGHMSYAQASGASHAATAARALGSDWIDLGPLDDLPERRPALRTGSGSSVDVPLVAVRRGTKVDVFIGPCSHLAGPLYEGSLEEVRGSTCLVCPWHGSAFDLDSGQPRRGPTATAQEKLEVRMSAGHVMARLPARHE